MCARALPWPRMINLALLAGLMMLIDVSPVSAADRPPAWVGSADRAALAANDGDPFNADASRLGAAAERTKGLVPQFMSMFSRKTGKPKPPARVSRNQSTTAASAQAVGAVNPTGVPNRSGVTTAVYTQPTGQRPTANQADYRSAAATRSYRPAGVSPNLRRRGQTQPIASRSAPAVRTAPPGAPTARSLAAGRSRPATRQPQPDGAARTTAVVEALIHAHKLAESANSEAEFSQIFKICQSISVDQATAEEATFGRELASWALNRRGQFKAVAGRTGEALADFDMAVRLDSERWRAIHNRGVLLAQSGEFERAFDDFNRTAQLNPEFAKAFSNRAALYSLAGDTEAALRDYTRAVELDPKLAVAQRGCGRACHMLGRMDEALDYLDAAVELAPDDATTLTSRGDLLTDLGYYADAADDYEQALAANADSVAACRSSAWLLATCPEDSIRNPELALRRAQQAVRRERTARSESYDTLAAAQANIGDFQRAVRTIEKAIDLAAGSERAVYEDRLKMYKQSMPMRIAAAGSIEQAHYER